jgi:hypothetical protein
MKADPNNDDLRIWVLPGISGKINNPVTIPAPSRLEESCDKGGQCYRTWPP